MANRHVPLYKFAGISDKRGDGWQLLASVLVRTAVRAPRLNLEFEFTDS
jgi:hypothetical protein